VSIQRILIFRAGAVGDFVVTLPALAALREAYPGAAIDLIGYPERAILAQHLVNRIHDVDAAHWSSLFSRAGDLSHLEPVLADADLAIAYMNDPDGAVGENLHRVGVHRTLFHNPRPDEDGDAHAVDHLLEPIISLGITPNARVPSIAPETARKDAARAMLATAGLSGPYAIFHAGAGGPHKQWPPECFAHLAERLWHEKEWPIAVTSGPADGALAERICQQADAPTVPLNPVDLPTLTALYADARLYVGCDTGPSHLSAATGTPSVILFGPTSPRVWGPRGPIVRIVEAPRQEMEALEPEAVMHAIRSTTAPSDRA
jgi:heptosyltransferase-2